MLSKSILKYIQSLHHKKYRDAHDTFIAEGDKVVKELLMSAKFECKMICATDDFFKENESLPLLIKSADKLIITKIELEKISLLKTPNKVVGIFYKRKNESIILKNKLSLVLCDIQDPGNMGTIIRIADWFNINDIICSKDCVDQYNPKVVQASMGSIARVNITYTDLTKFINNNKELNTYAATLNGTSIYAFNKTPEGLIIIGNESKGINDELLKLATEQISIPRLGNAESLNAAVAAGIILSHFIHDSS